MTQGQQMREAVQCAAVIATMILAASLGLALLWLPLASLPFLAALSRWPAEGRAEAGRLAAAGEALLDLPG